MRVRKRHRGIPYELVPAGEGQWCWSFDPPGARRRTGRIVGAERWAAIVVKRAIDVWLHLRRGERATWLPRREPVTLH
jgi:hypothetical protein